MVSVMDRIRSHQNVGTNASAGTIASGYVSAVGELIPFPASGVAPYGDDVIATGRGGILILLALTGGIAGLAYITRKYQR